MVLLNVQLRLDGTLFNAELPEQFWNYAEKLASVVSSYIVKEGEEISPLPEAVWLQTQY